MKKLLFLTMTTVALLFTSCSNDQSSLGSVDLSDEQVPVTINFSTNENTSLRNVLVDSSEIKSLMYIVYNEPMGQYYKHQYMTAEGLDQITENLPQGSYRIVIVAANHIMPNTFDEQTFPRAVGAFNMASFQISSASADADYFYNELLVNVTEGSVNETVTLERITTKLEFVPADLAAIPANVESISFGLDLVTYQSFSFKKLEFSSEPHPLMPNRPKYLFRVTLTKDELLLVNENNPISIILLPLSSPYRVWNFELPITADFYKGDNIVKSVTLKRFYKLERDKVLRLSGNLFQNVTEWNAADIN